MTPNEFYDALIADVVENASNLDKLNLAELRRYYRGLVEKRPYHPFFRYNWQRRTEPVSKRINGRPARKTPWRILDAGCGVGTESLYFANLRDDVAVTGADLNAARLAVAEARQQAWERRWQRPLPLQFRQKNIFELLSQQTFDLIWTMEAISHIDPAETFLEAAFASLEPGGQLVISDSHLLNTAMAWRILKMRRDVPLRGQKALADGQQVSYAHERLFAVPQLSRLLHQVGFTAVSTQISIFFPPRLARRPELFSLAVRLDKLANKLPLLRQVGGIYTMVAAKR